MPSKSEQLAYLSLTDVATAIAKKELSPVEVTQATLDRISALDGKLHAYYTVFADAALAAAKAAEGEINSGSYRGPMHGIPVAIKDIYESGPTTGGSKVRKDYVAQQDCTSVKKLKQAGSIVLGKLATYSSPWGASPGLAFSSRREILEPRH
jgi:Asp-tRNA(Asn)/Glu-tRNA(Gln) amidotransferase A subunit family amidase